MNECLWMLLKICFNMKLIKNMVTIWKYMSTMIISKFLTVFCDEEMIIIYLEYQDDTATAHHNDIGYNDTF